MKKSNSPIHSCGMIELMYKNTKIIKKAIIGCCKLGFFFIVLNISNISTMEKLKNEVVIIKNMKEINNFKNEKGKLVIIGGGTYSPLRYMQYYDQIKKECGSINDMLDAWAAQLKSPIGSKKKRNEIIYEGTPKHIDSYVTKNEKSKNLSELKFELPGMDDSKMIDFFINQVGLDNQRLESNIEKLIKAVEKEGLESGIKDDFYFVHCFLPNYCIGLREKFDVKNNDDIEYMAYFLKLFLNRASKAYKMLYENSDIKTKAKITILIPPIDYFIDIIKGTKNDAESIADCFQKFLGIKDNDLHNKFILLNNNIDNQSNEISKLLGINSNIMFKKLELIDSDGHLTSIFNPYVLSKNEAKNKFELFGNKKYFDNFITEYKCSLVPEKYFI